MTKGMITVGPAVMTTLIAGGGAPGWAVLGVVLVAAGATTIPVTRWALRVHSHGDRGPRVRAREGIAAAGDVA